MSMNEALKEICDNIISEIGLSHSCDAYKNCIIIELNEPGYEVEKNAVKYISIKVAHFDVDILIEKKTVLMVAVKNMIYGYDIVRIRNYIKRYEHDYGYFINFSHVGVQIQKVFRNNPHIINIKVPAFSNDPYTLLGCIPLLTEEDYHVEALAHKVVGELGFGLKENVYQKALQIEFEEIGHDLKSEDTQDVFYKGMIVCSIRSDPLIDDRILIELKATQKLTAADVGQTRKYLRKYNLEYGYLINHSPFGVYVRKVTNVCNNSNNIQ